MIARRLSGASARAQRAGLVLLAARWRRWPWADRRGERARPIRARGGGAALRQAQAALAEARARVGKRWRRRPAPPPPLPTHRARSRRDRRAHPAVRSRNPHQRGAHRPDRPERADLRAHGRAPGTGRAADRRARADGAAPAGLQPAAGGFAARDGLSARRAGNHGAEVRRSTAPLRSAIVRGRLAGTGPQRRPAPARERGDAGRAPQQLAALESRQRIASRAASGTASARPTMPWPWPNRRAIWPR
jgi:hypothetical protein